MHLNQGQFAHTQSKANILRILNIQDEKNIGILFTNLSWDASMIGVDITFKDSFEWVNETIKWFVKNKHKTLIIKVHPAEGIVGTRLSFLTYIRSMFPELPGNIKIIPPKSEFSIYDLMDIVDYGIVYTTTAGLELVIKGKPVITVASTHYRGHGFTYDSTDIENYFNLLNKSEELIVSPEMKDLAKKYGYLHFCAREIPFDFIKYDGKKYLSSCLDYKNWRELLPGSNEYLDLICNGIINNKEFLKNI